MSASPVYVSLEFTPNPNTLKYSVNRVFLEKGAAFFDAPGAVAGRSPLADKLFGVPGISGVMVGRDFVTVSKAEGGDWDVVHRGASNAIESHLNADLPVLVGWDGDAPVRPQAGEAGGAVEARIREILDAEIRPAVARDGGDITFERFDAGVVYLQLKGACAGCPSSTMTLKMGIETRLRELIPEVKEVVSA